jgi:hypothetical protein
MDPAPGSRKRCFYKYMGPETVPAYQQCATENSSCQIGASPAVVAFGVSTNWVYKSNITGSIRCDVAAFGSDPAKGQVKTCKLAVTPFNYCSTEGGPCVLPIGASIAFGANGRFIIFTDRGGTTVPCSISTFKSDPAPGQQKQCYSYQPPLPAAAPPTYTWCAPAEGGNCKIGDGRSASVAYGAYGRFIFLPKQTGDIGCNLAAFGGVDPYVNVHKACYYKLY